MVWLQSCDKQGHKMRRVNIDFSLTFLSYWTELCDKIVLPGGSRLQVVSFERAIELLLSCNQIINKILSSISFWLHSDEVTLRSIFELVKVDRRCAWRFWVTLQRIYGHRNTLKTTFQKTLLPSIGRTLHVHEALIPKSICWLSQPGEFT